MQPYCLGVAAPCARARWARKDCGPMCPPPRGRVEAATHVGAHLVAHQHRRPALGQTTHDQFVAMLMVATWLGLGLGLG